MAHLYKDQRSFPPGRALEGEASVEEELLRPLVQPRTQHGAMLCEQPRVKPPPGLRRHASRDGRKLEKVAAADELDTPEGRDQVHFLTAPFVLRTVAELRDKLAHLLVKQV